MKKRTFLLFTVILIVLSYCTEDNIKIEQNALDNTTGTINVQVGMPAEGTRIALTPDKLDLKLAWEEGDQLHLVFVDGADPSIKKTETVTVRDVTGDGRWAKFDIEIPSEIISGTFDLHGVYSNSLSEVGGEEHHVVLPETPWSGSLNDIQENNLFLIKFSAIDVNKNSPFLNVNFEHVGSMFRIEFKNTGALPINNIVEAQLFADSPIWAHKNAGRAKYDLINDIFVEGTTTSDNMLPFIITETNLDPEETLDFWGWYPPVQGAEDKYWPELNLKIIDSGGNELSTSYTMPARTSAMEVGKVYHVLASSEDPVDTDLLRGQIDFQFGYSGMDENTMSVDLGKILVHTLADAAGKQPEIDIMGFWSGNETTGSPILFVAGGNYNGWAYGRAIIADWTTRNPGILFRLDNPTAAEIQEFENIKEKEDVVMQFETVESSIQNRSSYQLLNNGPSQRINGMSKENIGEIFYFKSEARDLYAAFRVSAISATTVYGKYTLDIISTSVGNKPTLVTTAVSEIITGSPISGGTIANVGGSAITARGICWSKTPAPTVDDAKTINGTGVGVFDSEMTDLEHGTTYYVRAYATNTAGTGYGNQQIFTTLAASPTVQDVDGNEYKTVVIGNQVWFAENLRTTKYNDGTAIHLETDSATFENAITPAFCWYNNDETTYGPYGALYNNYAVATGRLCPEGWHVPTDGEWFVLENHVDPTVLANQSSWRGVDLGTKLKSTSWNGTDDFGFGILATGGFSAKGAGHGFTNSFGSNAYFWTSTVNPNNSVQAMRRMVGNAATMFKGNTDRSGGYSVRCLKDNN